MKLHELAQKLFHLALVLHFEQLAGKLHLLDFVENPQARFRARSFAIELQFEGIRFRLGRFQFRLRHHDFAGGAFAVAVHPVGGADHIDQLEQQRPFFFFVLGASDFFRPVHQLGFDLRHEVIDINDDRRLDGDMVIAHATRISGTATAAPLPSPRRMPRFSNGSAPSALSISAWPGSAEWCANSSQPATAGLMRTAINAAALAM